VSRKVVHDLVMPLVLKLLDQMGAGLPSYAIPHDTVLEDYLDEQLSIYFGVCGGRNHCEELEKAIKEAQQRDPEGFKEFVKQLLQRYIKLKAKIIQGIREAHARAKRELPWEKWARKRREARMRRYLYEG